MKGHPAASVPPQVHLVLLGLDERPGPCLLVNSHIVNLWRLVVVVEGVSRQLVCLTEIRAWGLGSWELGAAGKWTLRTAWRGIIQVGDALPPALSK